jgi:hypothetical protein
VVNLDHLYEQDADAAGWNAAKIVLECNGRIRCVMRIAAVGN